MNEFEVGDKVRFWTLDDCVRFAMQTHIPDVAALARMKHWGQEAQIIGAGREYNTWSIRFADGEIIDASERTITGSQEELDAVARSKFGEDYL